MFFALVIQSSSLKFGRQHRCSLRLPFNVPLPSLGLSDEPKEHLHEDANTYQWPTLLGNFVLNCSLTKSIIKQICQFFFLKKRNNKTLMKQLIHCMHFVKIVRLSFLFILTSLCCLFYSLHLTTLCLQYKPPVVACACIHLASKWSNWEVTLLFMNSKYIIMACSTFNSQIAHFTVNFSHLHYNVIQHGCKAISG